MEKLASTLERLKGLREQFNISVEEMAKAANITAEEYLKIESGKADVSFTFLFKCASKLGVDLSSIVSGGEPRLTSYTYTKKDDGMEIKRREGFNYTHLAYLFKDRLSEPFVVTAKYSKTLENSAIALSQHAGQELNYILEGSLKVQIDSNIEILNSGDSLYYDGRKKHGMVAINGKDCKFLSVVIKGGGKPEDEVEFIPKFEKKKTVNIIKDDNRIYKKFVKETIDENGMLTDITFNPPDNFNFGYDCVDELAKKSPDKLAMLWVDARGVEKRFSFSDMSKLSNQAANYFIKKGIKKGDKVLVVLRRHYQFWIAITALHKIGAVLIPGTDQLMAKDFVYRFNQAGIKAIICTGYGNASIMADEAIKECPGVSIKIMANGEKPGWDNFDKEFVLESDKLKRIQTHKDDIQIMFFSSGTTGMPKIVKQKATYGLGHIVTAKWWHNVMPDGLHFTLSDTGWAKSVWGKYYGQWLCEGAVFTCDFEKFHATDLLPMFKKYNITTFCAPPTIFRFFIKEDLSKHDLSSLKYVCIAGEALNPEVYNQFYAATGLKLMEGFGQTEATVMIFNMIGTTPKPGSMGKISPAYKIAILDSDLKPVKRGSIGEICILTDERMPMGMFDGYGDEAKTKEAWDKGVFHTGDTAWQDEDGYLWYVGRTDDLIKSSGYRIGPFEIESVIMEIPYVLECAVVGVPDLTGERGQLVKATIVLKAGTKPSEELKKEIQNYVKTHTAPYKYPRIIEFAESLPKTISGKIRRVELRKP